MESGTFQTVRAELPVAVVEIRNLSIQAELGEHAKAMLYAIIEEAEGRDAIEQFQADTNVKIWDGDKILFSGVPSNVQVKHLGGTYEVNMEIYSYSILLDIKKESKSFQNIKNTYISVMKETVNALDGMVKDMASKGAVQKGPYIRYEETAWEFVKRMASCVGAKIMPSLEAECPQIVVGLLKANSYTNKCQGYELEKDMKTFLVQKENGAGGTERNCKTCSIETKEIYGLSDEVFYKGEPYIVVKLERNMNKGQLINRYVCNKKEELNSFHYTISNYRDSLLKEPY